MSDYKFDCPHCGQSLEAPEDMLGETIDCPSCNGKLELPKPEPAPPPRPRPQRPRPQHTQQRTQQKQTVETNVKQGALIGGVVCFILGVIMMCVSLWTVIVYAPLFLAAFVLSIVAMAQKRIAGGVILLVLTVAVPPVLLIAVPSFKAARSAAQNAAQARAAVAATVEKEPEVVRTAAVRDPSEPEPEPKPQAKPAFPTDPKPAPAKPPAPVPRKPVDPQQVLREGIPNTKTSYDKFKGWTWVKPVQETDVEINANVELGFQPYIGVSDQKTVLFRIYTHYIDRRSEYHDTDWIFYESIILLNADRQKLTFTLDYGDRDSDVEDWGLMEYADILLQPARVEELSTFIKAQPIDIRFAGKSVVDGKLNSANVDAIKDMIAAWRMLTATE